MAKKAKQPDLPTLLTERVSVTVSSDVAETFRLASVRERFDLPASGTITETFEVDLPVASDTSWTVGCIVGPSGSGKTTLAKHHFTGDIYQPSVGWPNDKAFIDGFPKEADTGRITHLLTSVGFSSAPSWQKPYAVLSGGEKFRADTARGLCRASTSEGKKKRVVFDEWTSVVDRTVAQIGSAALRKAIDDGLLPGVQLVCVSCHYDFLPWIGTDWVLDMADGGRLYVNPVKFAGDPMPRGWLHRPPLTLDVRRCDRSLWSRFRRHHYLNHKLHKGARCFAAFLYDEPVAFASSIPHPHATRSGWREHRTVTLPDYQGLGIGNKLSGVVAAAHTAGGKPYFSTTSHPAMIGSRRRNPLWRTTRKRAMKRRTATKTKGVHMAKAASATRPTEGFEYIGPPDRDAAKVLDLPV